MAATSFTNHFTSTRDFLLNGLLNHGMEKCHLPVRFEEAVGAAAWRAQDDGVNVAAAVVPKRRHRPGKGGQNGVVTRDVLLDNRGYITKPLVIDPRSEGGNSYKVVTTMRREEGAGAGSDTYTLVINEYERSAQKPFVFLHNDIIYLGQCEHF